MEFVIVSILGGCEYTVCNIGNVGQKVSCKLLVDTSSKAVDGGNSETSATQTISVRCHCL